MSTTTEFFDSSYQFVLGIVHQLQYELIFTTIFLIIVAFTSRTSPGPEKAPKSKKDLKNSPTAFAQHIVDLCATKYGKALDLFLSSDDQNLSGVSEHEYHELVLALAIASVRVGRPDRLAELFKRLHKRNGIDGGLLGAIMRVLSSRQQHSVALHVLETWREVFEEKVPSGALSCLVHCAVECGKSQQAESFLDTLKGRNDANPRDYATIIRLYTNSQQPEKAMALIKEMESRGMTPDNVSYNMVLAACSHANQSKDVSTLLSSMPDADAVTFNTRLKACVRSKDPEQAFAIFEEMKAANIAPTQVTFGTLIECCTRSGALERAIEVLKLMAAYKVARNNVVCTSLIKGFVAQDKVEQAMAVFQEMKEDVMIEPDNICYSVLIKAHCDRLDLDQALELLEDFLEKGHQPDEIMFNNLLAGCAHKPHVALGEKLLTDMVAQKIKPTVATFSIMLKMYAKAGDVVASAKMLKTMPEIYKVMPAPRLYTQHISWCIRLRRGASALQVYKMMVERIPDLNADQILGSCASFNMMDTGTAMIEMDPARFSHAELRRTMDALHKKKKQCLAQRVGEVLEERGITI